MDAARPRTYNTATALAAIRRGIIPIMLAGALLGGMALAYVLAEDEVYEAEAIVLPRDPGFANEAAFDSAAVGSPPPVLADTDLAALDQIARLTSSALDGSITASTVSESVTVTDTGTGLITIEAEASDPAGSSELANAYAIAVIRSRTAAQVSVIDRAEAAATAELEAAGRGSEEGRELESTIAELRAFRTLQTGNLEQVQMAIPPTSPESRPIVSSAVGGGLAGILLGIAAALLLDRGRPRVHDRKGAEDAFGMPVIGSLGDGKRGEDVDTIEAIRGRILHRVGAPVPRSILIIPLEEEPAWEVAGRLADAVATSGRRTLLIDASLDATATGSGAGLAELLEHRTKAADVVTERGSGAHEISGGTPAADSVGLLDRQATHELLEKLGGDYDLTVLCAPSPLMRPNAISLVGWVDMTLAVVERGALEADCRRLLDELGRVGSTFAGTILLSR